MEMSSAKPSFMRRGKMDAVTCGFLIEGAIPFIVTLCWDPLDISKVYSFSRTVSAVQ